MIATLNPYSRAYEPTARFLADNPYSPYVVIGGTPLSAFPSAAATYYIAKAVFSWLGASEDHALLWAPAASIGGALIPLALVCLALYDVEQNDPGLRVTKKALDARFDLNDFTSVKGLKALYFVKRTMPKDLFIKKVTNSSLAQHYKDFLLCSYNGKGLNSFADQSEIKKVFQLGYPSLELLGVSIAELKAAGIDPDVVDFNTAIQSMEAGDLRPILKLKASMEKDAFIDAVRASTSPPVYKNIVLFSYNASEQSELSRIMGSDLAKKLQRQDSTRFFDVLFHGMDQAQRQEELRIACQFGEIRSSLHDVSDLSKAVLRGDVRFDYTFDEISSMVNEAAEKKIPQLGRFALNYWFLFDPDLPKERLSFRDAIQLEAFNTFSKLLDIACTKQGAWTIALNIIDKLRVTYTKFFDLAGRGHSKFPDLSKGDVFSHLAIAQKHELHEVVNELAGYIYHRGWLGSYEQNKDFCDRMIREHSGVLWEAIRRSLDYAIHACPLVINALYMGSDDSIMKQRICQMYQRGLSEARAPRFFKDVSEGALRQLDPDLYVWFKFNHDTDVDIGTILQRRQVMDSLRNYAKVSEVERYFDGLDSDQIKEEFSFFLLVSEEWYEGKYGQYSTSIDPRYINFICRKIYGIENPKNIEQKDLEPGDLLSSFLWRIKRKQAAYNLFDGYPPNCVKELWAIARA